MADTGDAPSTGGRAGPLGRFVRSLATHRVPAADAVRGRPTVGLVACHLVSGGYGDQVVDRVEQALDHRGHLAGPLEEVDRRAPVVVVAHAGPRSRPLLSAVGVDVAVLAGRPVALVAYGPVPTPDPRPLDALRCALCTAGARVADGTVLLDTARLHRPAATGRPGAHAVDPFEQLTLALVLDDLLTRAPTPAPTPPRRTR